jgi:hypothetical protein
MANFMFDKARQKFLEGGLQWLSQNFKVALVRKGSWVPSQANDDVVSTVLAAGATFVARSANLATKTSTGGIADAADDAPTFAAVAAGAACEALVVFRDSGSDATSEVVLHIDTAGGTLPITPFGGDITVSWDNTSGVKIFKL